MGGGGGAYKIVFASHRFSILNCVKGKRRLSRIDMKAACAEFHRFHQI